MEIMIIIVALVAWFIYKSHLRYKSEVKKKLFEENEKLISLDYEKSYQSLLHDSVIEIQKEGITEIKITEMTKNISEYIYNKFISKSDFSFLDFYEYQPKHECKVCKSRHPLFILYEKINNLSDESSKFRCNVCNETIVLSNDDYLNESIDDINFSMQIRTKKRILLEKYKDYLDGQSKMHKLFLQKEININYFDLILLIRKIESDIFKDFSYNSIINPAFGKIKPLVGDSQDVKLILEEFCRISRELNIPNIISEKYEIKIIGTLLKQFDITIDENELVILIEQAKESLSLQAFEQNLGKEKIPLYYDFSELNGVEFEEYVKKIFQHLGFEVSDTNRTGDQGADLILSKGGSKTVVQTKNHKKKISNKAIQEVVAAKNYYNATNAKVVVSSTFTPGAIDLASKNDVDLWDRQDLISTVKQINNTL